MSLLERVVAILEGASVRFAVVGAVAVASRGVPRSTFDLDLFTTDKRTLNEELWSELRTGGIPVEVRRGDFDDPLAGVTRVGQKPDQIDVVVGRSAWERAVIERAETIEVHGLMLGVPIPSDLILLKLAAGGPIDYQDAFQLLKVGPREQLVSEIASRIGDLPKDAQALWQRLLSEA